MDLKEIRPDLNEISLDLDRSNKIRPTNHSNRWRTEILICFSIRSVENQFFILKPVNRPTDLDF